MKKYLTLLILALAVTTVHAQDDDVYFVPSKSSQAQSTQQGTTRPKSHYTPITEDTYDADNWAAGRGNNGWDVDAYNRRTQATDTASNISGQDAPYADDENTDGSYTSLLVRFHSPRIGVYVSSPYYSVLTDYYWADPWLSPWYGGFYYSSWYGWGWNWGWPYYGPAYAWNPWWDYGWGWRPPHFWHPGHQPSWAYRPIPRRGTSTYRPSRDYLAGNRGSMTRPSRNYYNPSNISNRTFNDRNYSNQTRPSRSYGNNSRSTTTTPSRSFGNSGGSTTPSRSFSQPSGGGRSFGGGGGGRSFGGRR